jgi:hypothetical protein
MQKKLHDFLIETFKTPEDLTSCVKSSIEKGALFLPIEVIKPHGEREYFIDLVDSYLNSEMRETLLKGIVVVGKKDRFYKHFIKKAAKRLEQDYYKADTEDFLTLQF